MYIKLLPDDANKNSNGVNICIFETLCTYVYTQQIVISTYLSISKNMHTKLT